ncbi:MAG TPA: FAD-dependent oxidoreductase [Candidatus Dormibacteraeota bacterium]|nr:FAD-dependent oxidoreductase [Candidatus Dormibacteraeota bacterium]
MSNLTRRDFLKTAGMGAAALALPEAAAGVRVPQPQAAGAAALGPGGQRKKVIVVGAGMAGLVAAYELDRSGHDVTLLESQLRPGGRVLTLRAPFSDGLYAEAGAASIPNTHRLALAYARQFQLKLVPFYPAGEGFVNQIAGRRVVGPRGDVARAQAGLTAQERRLGAAGMWEKYVSSAVREIGNPAAPGWSPAPYARYDNVTFTHFLRQRGASPAAVRVMLLGRDLDGVSALRMLADLATSGAVTGHFKIDGGNDRLPRALAQSLSRRIRYGAWVRQIHQDRQRVRATFVQGNLQHTIEADDLICTIPFPALRQVEFTPILSDEKIEAIEGTYYLSVTAVWLQEDRRFWQAGGLNGFALSDWPIEVSAPTFDQPGRRGILAGRLDGDMARRAAALPEDRRIETVLNEMETLFPGAREHFEGGASKSWDEDFWARGAMQWFRPGQMISYGPYMATPEGRIHFAGEHTSAWPGWIEGAIHSGLRAAREVDGAAS